MEEDEAPRTEIATMEATMTGDGTGGDLGAEVQDTDQSPEAPKEAEGGVGPGVRMREGRVDPGALMKEGGVDLRVHTREGNPEPEAEKGEEHHQDLGQGHMKDVGVAPPEDQGLTVALPQGHQDMEKRSRRQETVTVGVEVEARPLSLTIKL